MQDNRATQERQTTARPWQPARRHSSISSPKAWNAYRAEMHGLPGALTCPECGGLGWLRADAQLGDPVFGTLVPCETCTSDRRLEWITRHCGLERAELDARIADWNAGPWPELRSQREEARTAMERVIERRIGFLAFWGDFGAGKTFALQIIVNELRLQQVEVFYAPLAHVLDHLRSLYRRNEICHKETSDFWQRLLDIPVLALDEVTRFHGTSWAQERVWMLADIRYRRMASHLTVFATNDDPNDSLPISEPIGYLYSRLRQGHLVELRGDLRPLADRID